MTLRQLAPVVCCLLDRVEGGEVLAHEHRCGVVGAVGGTGAVLATKGKEVEIPGGSRWTVQVKDRVALN